MRIIMGRLTFFLWVVIVFKRFNIFIFYLFVAEFFISPRFPFYIYE